MDEKRYQYLIRVQFLGFRYNGWQKQPGQRTVEGMLVKTLRFIWPKKPFKLLGAGRTDAKVSAEEAAFVLMTKGHFIADTEDFLALFNENLPPDIRASSVARTSKDFNIIQHAKMKEYRYLFSYGDKFHPFCAPLMANFRGDLDIGIMKRAAQLFVGTHDFSSFTARLQENTRTERTISACFLKENTSLTANFFPKESYALHVCGAGFMRYQIRMMMGALVQLGRGELGIADIARSLIPGSNIKLTYVAPGSGLMLYKLDFGTE